MKKKLLVFLVALCLALGAGTTLTAFAGVNHNSPTGDGLMSGGGLNNTNYTIRDDGEPSAYGFQQGTTIYDLSGVAGAHNVSAYQVVGTDDFADVAKFVMKVDIYDFGANASSANFAIGPFAQCARIDWVNNSMMAIVMRATNGQTEVHSVNGVDLAPTTVKTHEYIINDEQVTPTVKENGVEVVDGFGLQTDLLKAEKDKGRGYITYWFEFDIADKSMTIFAGYDDGAGNVEKTEYGTIKNAFKLSLNENNQAAARTSWLWQPASDIKFDNYKLYSVKADGAEKKVFIDCDFETEDSVTYDPMYPNGTKLSVTSDGTARIGKFNTLDSVITVTNPEQDARIVSNNALAVDNRLDKTFEMTSTFKLKSFGDGSTRKVGVALGLENYRQKLSAPQKGASLIYLTKNGEGQIVLGADNIAEDGTATATGEVTVLNGAALGEYITLDVVGNKDGSVDVTVGEQTVNFPNIKANGHVAISQTGEGEVSYEVFANDFAVTGYQLTENEGEKVTSSFNGGWISPAKFYVRNNIAPSAHVTAVEGGHAVTGITPESQKVGFYGSSTHAALTFLKPYADFVMQFDYISVPYKQRGKLGGIESNTPGNRFSPFYAVFGGQSGESQVEEYYAVGIAEGNATQYFWGAESLIVPEGKLKGEGATLKVISEATDTEDSDTAIPKYGANPEAGGKPAYTVNGYIKPSDEEKSFYNKTTRFKLVVINNNVALWAANVDENGATVGEYRKVYEYTVSNSFGYVGFITDSPAWCELDNVAITPISTEVALEKGLNAEPAVNLVADVPVSEMATDPVPEMLAKPVLKADTAAKKVTWDAIAGAGEYEVTVRFDGEIVDEKTVAATEFNMSEYTDEGDYTVTVVALPADLEAYQKSLSSNITYTVKAGGNEPGGNEPGGNEPGDKEPDGDKPGTTETPKDGGCGCGGAASGAFGAAAIVLVLGSAAFVIRRRKA